MEGASDTIEIEWLILADAAQMVGGKLYLLGGGWDRFTANSGFPANHKMSVAAAFSVPWNETNRRHPFTFSVEDEDGTVLADVGGGFEIGRPPGIPAGKTQRSQIVIDLTLQIQKPGSNVIIARIGDVAERRCTFTTVEERIPTTQLPQA